MSDSSARLALPYIQPSQAQKHVTHNEGMALLDALVQLSVESRSVTPPPASPAMTARHIVPAGATGPGPGRRGASRSWPRGAAGSLPCPRRVGGPGSGTRG